MNFALILFLATRRHRRDRARRPAVFAKRRAADAREPWWIEYPKSFFPVLLIVFLLRSFVAEPFKIPSSSMRPTLEVGDFILVNKFAYGLRLPILEQKIVPDRRSEARRRRRVPLSAQPVAGLHQARHRRRRRHGRLQGQAADGQRRAAGRSKSDGIYSYLEGLRFETMDAVRRDGATPGGGRRSTRSPSTRRCRRSAPAQVRPFAGRENCDYNPDGSGFACKVPPGHYFMMGDNRDRSDDSRYWGSCPTTTSAAARSSSGSTGTTSRASRGSASAAAFDREATMQMRTRAARIDDAGLPVRRGGRRRLRHGRLPRGAGLHRVLLGAEGAREGAGRRQGPQFGGGDQERVPDARRRRYIESVQAGTSRSPSRRTR